MFAFQICMLGIIATGGALVIGSPYRNAIVYGTMACLSLSYFYFFCVRKRNLSLNTAEKALICFITIGIMHILLSLADANHIFGALDVYYDKSFVLRQAVYLFMLPAIILFRDELYTRKKEYLITHYGELVFWALYIFHFFYVGKAITVSAQLLLCWLALRIKSPQSWRNWLRFAAVLLTPFSKDGVSTMLIFRILFAAIYLAPLHWKRTALKGMAVGLLITILLVSFLVPMLITDTSFISDRNTRWRLNYWTDALNSLGNTYGLGTGYGTSYASKGFTAVTKDFYATDDYSKTERTFVLACHNSFVSVAMRTGLPGIVAFLLFIILMLWEMLKYRTLPSKAAFFALFGAVVCIAFNVGLESPNYLFSFVFCLGECNQEVARVRRESRLSENAVLSRADISLAS